MIKFACPHCGARLSSGDEHGGQDGSCPRCKGSFRIPVVEARAKSAVAEDKFESLSPSRNQSSAQKNSLSKFDDSMNLGLGIAGVFLLLIGSFSPAISYPILGGVSYASVFVSQMKKLTLDEIGISAVLVLASCIASVIFLATRKFSRLWVPVIGASVGIAIVLCNFLLLQYTTSKDAPKDADNPFAAFARSAAQAVQPAFGLAIIALAIMLLIASAVFPKRRLSR
jgi:hypothetical protein